MKENVELVSRLGCEIPKVSTGTGKDAIGSSDHS